MELVLVNGPTRIILSGETPKDNRIGGSTPKGPSRIMIDSNLFSPVPQSKPVNKNAQTREKTKSDLLCDRAKAINPEIETHRIKGRIDSILSTDITFLLDWGNRNLEPLRDVSTKKSFISNELSRIDAIGWLKLSKEASCKKPSFLDRFSAKSPDYYEGMLSKARSELLSLVDTLNKMKIEFFREVHDLYLDAISLQVCIDDLPDDHKLIADNRVRTLLASHQTAAMLQQTIELSLKQSADHIQQIDSFLSVTMPQWKMVNNS